MERRLKKVLARGRREHFVSTVCLLEKLKKKKDRERERVRKGRRSKSKLL